MYCKNCGNAMDPNAAICVKCGNLAYVSHRLVDGDKQVLLGEKMEYEPLCRECYYKALKEAENSGK